MASGSRSRCVRPSWSRRRSPPSARTPGPTSTTRRRGRPGGRDDACRQGGWSAVRSRASRQHTGRRGRSKIALGHPTVRPPRRQAAAEHALPSPIRPLIRGVQLRGKVRIDYGHTSAYDDTIRPGQVLLRRSGPCGADRSDCSGMRTWIRRPQAGTHWTGPRARSRQVALSCHEQVDTHPKKGSTSNEHG
jgi:hypothetical protein